jgi:polyhydroxyalkanoate synthesis regulator phasin
MARREAENLIARLRQMSEEGAASFFSELMANDTLRKRLGRAGEQFLNNKQSFDRNVETVLDFVNIPSKRDVRELKARLDHLNSQIVNLSIKIDRMLAAGSAETSEVKAKPKRPRKPKTTATD